MLHHELYHCGLVGTCVIECDLSPKKEHYEWIFRVFTNGQWSLWSTSTFMLMGWNSSLLLQEIYTDGWFQEAKKTQELLINTLCSSGRDRQAEQVNDPSNERCAEAGHTHHQSTLHWQGWEGELLSTLNTGAGETEQLITIWKREQIKESSHTRKYKTCAHTGHKTFVLGTFASGDNEPACLFPTSLVPFPFFLPNKDSSDHGGVQKRLSGKKNTQKNQWFHSGGQ